VERRSEPRAAANEPARVTILDEKQEHFPARVIDLSGKGLRLGAPRGIASGTLIRVDLQDSILLGEVSHGTEQGSEVQIGVQIEHVLTNLQQLERLRESLLEQSEANSRRSAGVR
jgi:hypothetical protein